MSKFQSFRVFTRKVWPAGRALLPSRIKSGRPAACCWPSCCSTWARSTCWCRSTSGTGFSTTRCRTRTSPPSGTSSGRFTYLAFGFIIIAVYRFYLTQLLQMRWRGWMTAALHGPLAGQQGLLPAGDLRASPRATDAPPDNPDQRIAEDMNLFTSYTVSLSMGLLNAVVTLVSFVGILWALSGSFGFSFNGSELQHPRLHGLDGGGVLRGRQRAHPLHRPPARSTSTSASSASRPTSATT